MSKYINFLPVKIFSTIDISFPMKNKLNILLKINEKILKIMPIISYMSDALSCYYARRGGSRLLCPF